MSAQHVYGSEPYRKMKREREQKGSTYKLPCAIDGSVVEFCFCVILDLKTCFDVFDGCSYE